MKNYLNKIIKQNSEYVIEYNFLKNIQNSIQILKKYENTYIQIFTFIKILYNTVFNVHFV